MCGENKMSSDILEKFHDERLARLESAFKECRFPDQLTLSFVAAEIGAPDEEVKVKCEYIRWFSQQTQEISILQCFSFVLFPPSYFAAILSGRYLSA